MVPVKLLLLIQRVLEGNADLHVEAKLSKEAGTLASPFSSPSLKPCSAAERNEILAGKTSVHALDGSGTTIPIELNKEQIDGILALSTELALSEKECVRLWRLASMKENRRLAETFASLATNSLESHIAEAATIILRMEKHSLLNGVLFLVQHRNSSEPLEYVMNLTNELLRRGLVSNLLKAIQDIFNDLRSPTCNFKTTDPNDLIVVAQTLFFLTYSTAITAPELQLLVDVVKNMTNETVSMESSKGNDRNSDGSVNLNRDIFQKRGVPVWKRLGMISFVILQFALSNSLRQGISRYDRSVNRYPFKDPENTNGVTFEDAQKFVTQGLCWRSQGARGFANLILATHAQSFVDDGVVASNEVLVYLRDAFKFRAFSYLRLCVLPIIEHCLMDSTITKSTSTSSATSSSAYAFITFVSDSLQDLVVELARLFAIYKDYHTYMQASNIESFKELNPTADTLEDLMNFYSVACNRLVSLPLILANDAKGGSHPYQYHPFFVRNIEMSWRDPFLMLSGLRLLGSVGRYVWSVPDSWRARIGSNSVGVFEYMKANTGPRRNMNIWDFLFGECIDVFASQLNGTKVASTTISSATPVLASSMLSSGLTSPDTLLSDMDTRYLIAISQLIANLGRCPSVALALHRDFDAVTRLFRLVSCPVSIYLKGALFQAIGSLCHGSVEATQEAWNQLELHNLLGFASNLVANPTSTKVTPNNISTSAQRGLRFELEVTESSVGVYPCTDGFLVMLESMLGHGIPNLLGQEYRVPGIVLYLEFIVDDVLNRAHVRPYSSNACTAAAQKWCLIARVIHILCIVLQNYNINAVDSFQTNKTSHSQNSSTLSTPLLSSNSLVGDWNEICSPSVLVSDFAPPVPVTFRIRQPDGTFTEKTCLKPKSAGFCVMAMLLVNSYSNVGCLSKLLGLVLQLLQECTIGEIQRAMERTDQSTSDTCVSIFCLMQPPEVLSETGSATATATATSFTLQPTPLPSYGLDENLSNVSLGPEGDSLCDGSFWQEKTVTACIGLIYECCLRQASFIQAIRGCKHLVTYVRSEQGKPATITVTPRSLVESLSTEIHLAKVAHFLGLTPRLGICSCLPSVSSMVVDILDYVAHNQSPNILLGSLSDTSDAIRSVVLACVQCICSPTRTHLEHLMQGDMGKLALDHGSLYFFTPSLQATIASHAIPPKEYIEKILCEENMDQLMGSHGSIKEAVLRLLLSTLSPNHICFCHTLLGLRQCMERIVDMKIDPVEAASLILDPRDQEPSNCLEAILLVVSHCGKPIEEHILFTEPNIALLCYEILYRLCSQPMTSSLVLAYLRRSTVQFIKGQMEQFLLLLSLNENDIIKIVGSVHQNQHKVTRNDGRMDVGDELEPRIAEIKVTLQHCLAWFLQICSLDLRRLERTPDVSMLKLRAMLELFFLNRQQTQDSPAYSSFDMDGIQQSPLTHFFEHIFDLPQLDFPMVTNKVILQLLAQATTPLVVGSHSDGNGFDSSMFSVVDISSLSSSCISFQTTSPHQSMTLPSLTPSDIQYGLQAAVTSNIFQQRIASATHLSRAWSQLVDLSLVGPHSNYIIGSFGLNSVDACQKFVDVFLLPILFILRDNSNDLEMIVAERLVQSVLVVVSSIQQFANAEGASVCSLLSLTQHHAVLTSALSLLLPSQSDQSSLQVSRRKQQHSIYFRGLLYNILCILLTANNDDSDRERLNNQSVSTNSIYQEVATSIVVDLITIISEDVLNGPLVWRLSAVSTLQSILTLLWGGQHVDSPLQYQQEQQLLEYSVTKAEDGVANSSHVAVAARQAYFLALQVLFSKDIVRRLIEDVFNVSDGERNRKRQVENSGLLESVVVLCMNVAKSVEGVNELLRLGLLQRLNDLQQFASPLADVVKDHYEGISSPLVGTGTGIGGSAGISIPFESQLLSIINLLQVMVVLSPTRPTLEGCLQFLLTNHLTMTHYLRLRTLTLSGLVVTQSLMTLLALVAKSPTAATSFGNDDIGSTSLFESVLGQYCDSFTLDVTRLVHKISQTTVLHPTPTSQQVLVLPGEGDFGGIHNRTNSKHANQWWLAIRATPGTTEELLESTMLEENGFLDRHGWNAFEQCKLECVMDILCQGSAFLRLRATAVSDANNLNVAHKIQRGDDGRRLLGSLHNGSSKNSATLMTIDFSLVIKAFQTSVTVLLQNQQLLSRNNEWENDENQYSAMNWLQSPHNLGDSNQSYQKSIEKSKQSKGGLSEGELQAFHFVAENLVTVLHVLVCASLNDVGDVRQVSVSWKRDIDHCAALCESFPAHGFVRQVIRWMGEKLDELN